MRLSVSLGVFSFGTALSSLHAQVAANRAPPHLGFVYPAGGRRGATFVVTIGGQNLAGANGIYFSIPGVSARIVDYERPLNQKELNALREELHVLQEKRGTRGPTGGENERAGNNPKQNDNGTPRRDHEVRANDPVAQKAPGEFTRADAERLAEIRETIARRGNRQANAAIAETVTLEIGIASETAAGECELRVRAANGLSNPIAFRIGQLVEITRPVITAMSRPTERKNENAIGTNASNSAPPDPVITLPVVANGQILPGDVRRYRFKARMGQRIVATLEARALIPYLADTVPGWFQPTLAVYDSQRHELAYQDDFDFRPDPMVSVEIPRDGTYVAEIKDALYRGREDFIYRLTIGEPPLVSDEPAVPIAGDETPSLLEGAHNDSVTEAEAVSLPRLIDGRIERPGDVDVYAFTGKAGAAIVAEVLARRLGSPLDSKLTLLDAAGNILAENDDCDDKAAGLLTHQADSRVSVSLPADGTYYAKIADVQGHGGARFSYRLRLGPPCPDFALRIVPSSVDLRAGGAVPVTIYALRHDGFDGEIRLALENAMPGLVLSGARIPAGLDKIQVTLTTPASPTDEPFELEVVGTALVAGRRIKRTAVAADDMMQAFAYHHLVTADKSMAMIVGRGAAFRVLSRSPLELTQNGKAQVRVAVPGARGFENIALELIQPPDGLTIEATEFRNGVIEVVLACDSAKLKTGTEGNLIFAATAERSNANDKKANGRAQRIAIGCVPAIPFKVADSAIVVR